MVMVATKAEKRRRGGGLESGIIKILCCYWEEKQAKQSFVTLNECT